MCSFILPSVSFFCTSSLDWDNFTDSSSVVAGPDHAPGGRAKAASDAAGRPTRRSAPSSTGTNIGTGSANQLKLAPTITSAVVPAVSAGQQIPIAARASTGLGNGRAGGMRRAKSGTSTPVVLTGD